MADYRIVWSAQGIIMGEVGGINTRAGEEGLVLTYPVAVVVQHAETGQLLSFSLQPLVIPATRVTVTFPCMIFTPEDLEERFRTACGNSYEAYVVKQRSGIVLPRGNLRD
jgi:hypothetical protein